MGAWGTGPFEDDMALDWVADLEESKGTKLLSRALAKVTKTVKASDYLEAPEGVEARAAAEVVAAINGKPGKDLPEEVEAWLESAAPKPDPQLSKDAAAAMTHVLSYEDSELRQLWEEAQDADKTAWRASMTDLIQRLTT